MENISLADKTSTSSIGLHHPELTFWQFKGLTLHFLLSPLCGNDPNSLADIQSPPSLAPSYISILPNDKVVARLVAQHFLSMLTFFSPPCLHVSSFLLPSQMPFSQAPPGEILPITQNPIQISASRWSLLESTALDSIPSCNEFKKISSMTISVYPIIKLCLIVIDS